MNHDHTDIDYILHAEVEALRKRLQLAESILKEDEEKWNQYISAVNTPSH